MINKTKGVIYGVIILLVGYMAGAIIKVPFLDNSMLNGDIGKANLYNNSTGSDSKACIEKLRNDTTYRDQMLASYLILSSRIAAADSLANATAKATEGIAEFKDLNKDMKAIANKTKNAEKLYSDLFTETEQVLSGKVSAEYEQLVSNAGHAFTVIDNDMSLSADVISTLSEYGMAKNNKSVLAAAAGWIQYGAEDAVFSGDSESIAEWEKVYAAAQNEKMLGALFTNSFPKYQAFFINSSKQIKFMNQKTIKDLCSASINKLAANAHTMNQSAQKLNGKINPHNNKFMGCLLAIKTSTIGIKKACMINMINTQF